MGIKEIKFNSNAIHTISQFVLDIAIIVLNIRVDTNIIINGEGIIIKMRLELNHQIWVRSSYVARHHLNLTSLKILDFIHELIRLRELIEIEFYLEVVILYLLKRITLE